MLKAHVDTKHRCRGISALALLVVLLGGCGDQVVIEGVDASNGALVGDSVIDNVAEGADAAAGEPYAEGDPYEAGETDEKNMGPNSPGYIPETID